jgi:hypothetical protein
MSATTLVSAPAGWRMHLVKGSLIPIDIIAFGISAQGMTEIHTLYESHRFPDDKDPYVLETPTGVYYTNFMHRTLSLGDAKEWTRKGSKAFIEEMSNG